MKNIAIQDVRNLIFSVLYIFAAYFAGSYISRHHETFANLVGFGELSRRLITRLLRLIALYLIVSSVLLLVILLCGSIWLTLSWL